MRVQVIVVEIPVSGRRRTHATVSSIALPQTLVPTAVVSGVNIPSPASLGGTIPLPYNLIPILAPILAQ